MVAAAFAAHRVRTAALQRRNLELLALQRQRETVQEALTRAYGRLRLLTRRLEAAREDERRHIARELHDELGPALTAVAINLQLLTQRADAPKHARRLADRGELSTGWPSRSATSCPPAALDEMGLVAALKAYLEMEAERTWLAIDVRGDPVEGLAPAIEISAFRWSGGGDERRPPPGRAAPSRGGARGGCLDLVVEDDGAGFDAARPDGRRWEGAGPLGMQERADPGWGRPSCLPVRGLGWAPARRSVREMSRIRIVLADDHAGARRDARPARGRCRGRDPGGCGDGREALELIGKPPRRRAARHRHARPERPRGGEA
jgi:hypothetical protein